MPAIIRSLRDNTNTLTKPRDVTACRLRNRLLPALQLCSDLLEYLFLLGANLEADEYHRRRTVLAYSQVCHDWRTAALATKSLWVQLMDFDDMSWKWNEEMLRRSHPLPVTIGSCTFPPREMNKVSSELGYLERIRTYRLGFADETWEVLEGKLREPAASLEYLSLAYVPLHPSKTHRPWYSFPLNLFDNCAPQFRRLKLEGCIVDFNASVLRSLTSLSVLNLDANHKLAPSAFEWIALVSTLPFLTDLFIKDAIYSASSLSEPRVHFSKMPPSKVRLHRLASLHLEGNIGAVATFLKYVILPASCSLSVACSEAQPGAEMEGVLSSFVDVLERTIRRRQDTENLTFPLLLYARASSIYISTDERHKDHPRPSSPLSSLNFDLEFHAHLSSSWEPFLTPILSAFSAPAFLSNTNNDVGPVSANNGLVSYITSLEILLPSCHSALAPFLRKATRLEALINLPVTLAKNLLPDLRLIPPHRSHSPPPTGTHMTFNPPSSSILAPVPYPEVPLPLLHTISFNDDKSTWGVPYGTLLSYLRWRSEDADAPLSRVIFRRCVLLEEKALELQAVGVEVQCDNEGTRWQNL
ncbi:unnamed protein product [Cyclocybe aegerita]|uniref:F-box domain-containing protein n=1 Tax=Cyclocybe aegerita TaxID=1973307 RepID=A0A8S0WTZ4_CYCAE|nr:unnamed protein product [Cyclocybe aegerita]